MSSESFLRRKEERQFWNSIHSLIWQRTKAADEAREEVARLRALLAVTTKELDETRSQLENIHTDILVKAFDGLLPMGEKGLEQLASYFDNSQTIVELNKQLSEKDALIETLQDQLRDRTSCEKS